MAAKKNRTTKSTVKNSSSRTALKKRSSTKKGTVLSSRSVTTQTPKNSRTSILPNRINKNYLIIGLIVIALAGLLYLSRSLFLAVYFRCIMESVRATKPTPKHTDKNDY